jgi:hypothetical protein
VLTVRSISSQSSLSVEEIVITEDLDYRIPSFPFRIRTYRLVSSGVEGVKYVFTVL